MKNLENKKIKLIKQGAEELFEKKVMFFHIEFPNMCNQRCSYCIEGRYSDDMINYVPWNNDQAMSVIDKIFKAYDESYSLCFILVGGEPTLQPTFLDFVEKLKTRKNTHMILTTNFTQSVEYYRNLDIPMVTSLHLDYHDPKEWLKKTIELRDLIVETRIMAHSKKMDKVREAYNLFMEAKDKYNLSFTVEELFPFTILGANNKEISYEPEYAEEDREWLSNYITERTPYAESLKEKAGLITSLFYRAVWKYSNGEEKILQKYENHFCGWFCTRNFVIIKPNGNLYFGWNCECNSKYNIFRDKTFPIEKTKTIICDKTVCPLCFATSLPKHLYIKDAPKYVDKKYLLKLKLQEKMKSYKNTSMKIYKFYKLIRNSGV